MVTLRHGDVLDGPLSVAQSEWKLEHVQSRSPSLRKSEAFKARTCFFFFFPPSKNEFIEAASEIQIPMPKTVTMQCLGVESTTPGWSRTSQERPFLVSDGNQSSPGQIQEVS